MNLKEILKYIFTVRNIDYDKIVVVFGKKIIIKNGSKPRNEARISTLMNLLNECGDITKCKPATGTLRDLQLVRLKALKMLKQIFEENDIKYWLDGGTCLGAYRHKGFIPWDDDIDIVVPEEDYKRAIEIVNKKLENSDLKIVVGGKKIRKGLNSTVTRLLDTKTNFIYLDIFPYAYSNNNSLTKQELIEKLQIIKEEFFTPVFTRDLQLGKENIEDFMPQINEKYKEYRVVLSNNEKNCYMFRGVESMSHQKKQTIHNIEDIFPLQKVPFEDDYFYAPNNIEQFLKNVCEGSYGDLMSFPPIEALLCHAYLQFNDINEMQQIVKIQNKKIDNFLSKV